MLARIDGKSPVEYLPEEAIQDCARFRGIDTRSPKPLKSVWGGRFGVTLRTPQVAAVWGIQVGCVLTFHNSTFYVIELLENYS
jgi:hypothetical protein